VGVRLASVDVCLLARTEALGLVDVVGLVAVTTFIVPFSLGVRLPL
jgi:hypothetical protein